MPSHKNQNQDDASVVIHMISSRYGAAPPNTLLGSLRRSNPQLDRFDWMLLIVGIEIDLKVRLPSRLIEADRKSIAQFAHAIATLPKVTSSSHTLDTLALLAQALLGDHGVNTQPRKRTQGKRLSR